MVRLKPVDGLVMVMVSPGVALPTTLPPVLVCAWTPPTKHIPSAIVSALRFRPLAK